MSEKLPQEPQNEEVDLGQLFNAIGRLFEKLFSFIGKVFKLLFSGIIYTLKPIVNNIKLIASVLLLAGIVGYVIDNYKEKTYVSEMLVKPYFDSKYKLFNNVDYFNALIATENISELSKIFKIDSTEAENLLNFEIEPGPETPNDLFVEYNEYITEIDTTIMDVMNFNDFVSNRDILSSNTFLVKAKSLKNNVFKSLEKGFVNTFENQYSKKLKSIRDSVLSARKQTYLLELKKIDSLQITYLQVMRSESENSNGTINSNTAFPLIQEKTKTKEYELFREELKIRDKIRTIDKILIEESQYYDILSSFDSVGAEDSGLMDKYKLVFPAVAFILLALAFMVLKIFKFIKNYE